MNRFVARSIMTAVMLSAATAWATQPQHWVHESQEDFASGSFSNATLTSQGELILGRTLKPVEFGDAMEFVTSFVQDRGGRVFFSTAPSGKIYRIDGDKTIEYYAPPSDQEAIWALGLDGKGNVLASITGEKPRLVKIIESTDGKKTNPVQIFDNPDVQNIWAIVTAPDGTLYLATGPDGVIWQVAPDAKPVEFVRLGDKTILSLALDQQGNLVAGTAGDALVIRIDTKTKKTFVLLDGGQADITSVLPDAKGNLFVAVARAGDMNDAGRFPGGNDDGEKDGGKSKPIDAEPETTDMNDVPEPAPAAAAPKTPATVPAAVHPQKTPESLSKLLDQAREQLQSAQKNGKHKNRPGQQSRPATTKRSKPQAANLRASSDEDKSELRGVYMIAADGSVTPVFEDSDTVYSLAWQHGQLLIGTGTAGKLYSYDPQTDTSALLSRLTDESITALVATNQDQVFLGTSNAGGIYRLASDIAETGTFTSDVLDSGHISSWGMTKITSQLPEGTTLTIATRSSNVRNTEDGAQFWSDWSPEMNAADYAAISSPSARFLQYRITLHRGEKLATPVLQQVNIAYQSRNLPPKLSSIRVEPQAIDDENNTAPRAMQITWDAQDPNNDQLLYRLYYRKPGTPTWVPLAKDLKETNFTWDTRGISDGKYQVQVVATDSPDNAITEAKTVAKVTSAFAIDTLPPVLSGIKTEFNGAKVILTGNVKDATSIISEVRIQIDSQQDWQLAASSDKIFDSPSEDFRIETRALPPGTHRILIRATDSAGNSAYETRVIQVPPDEGKK